jgi:hypothetical protein
MRPDIPCVNHPNFEADKTCRYCGDGFCHQCSRSIQLEKGFCHCHRAECETAFQAELTGPQRPCPFCAHPMPISFPNCPVCGKDSESLPEVDSQALVTVAKFFNSTEAQLAGTKLLSEGIWSFVADENMGSLYSAANFFLGGIRLQVKASDLAKARQILE